jgi:glycosyltransferase involved in cell wall biosynthesis
MRVGLNLVYMVPGETGGMEVYARELMPALQARGADLVAFVNRETAGEDLGVETVTVPVHARNRAQWVRGEQLLLPPLARRARIDLLHSLGGTAPARGPFTRVVTIHDLHYRTMPEAHFGLNALGMRVLVPLAARTSHRVLTVSEHSRREIVELLGRPAGKVDVTPNGLGRGPTVGPTPEPALRERLGLQDRRVVLSLSAKRPHKNLAGLLDALARIPRERRPVAVLPGYPTPHEAELREHARKLGIEDDVRFLGWTPDADVEGLLAMAAAFVMPSFAEGFGLPVLEAMARGVPVACSGTTALGEVAGDAALTFDPADPAQIAGAIDRLLADPGDLPARGRARAAQFTWERCAELTLAAYERASRQATSSRSRDRS